MPRWLLAVTGTASKNSDTVASGGARRHAKFLLPWEFFPPLSPKGSFPPEIFMFGAGRLTSIRARDLLGRPT